MGRDWSTEEVRATVGSYMSMLASELRGHEYCKTEHRRLLAPLLQDRSDGAIEFKHQNISAVLMQCGFPCISGYKPRRNYQRLLVEAVYEHLQANRDLAEAARIWADAPATLPPVADILERLVEPPPATDMIYPERAAEAPRAPIKIADYLEREARNASLGLAGEEFALTFEQARLRQMGRDRLADRVEHVSVTIGDGLGYDIRSFEPDGSDRMIEVKTTACDMQAPFFLSRTEVEVSAALDDRYHLYRWFFFRKDPKVFAVNGAVERTCRELKPVQFIARL